MLKAMRRILTRDGAAGVAPTGVGELRITDGSTVWATMKATETNVTAR